jgi:hypothetical protein
MVCLLFVQHCSAVILLRNGDNMLPVGTHRRIHDGGHAFESFHPRAHEGLVLVTRRNLLKAGLGIAGISLGGLLRHEEEARATTPSRRSVPCRSVILLWMAGGPSHIDTWDVKPERPEKNRGPFGAIPTKLPGVWISEHFPRQAAMMDRFTLIRSVDARHSNHEPNTVFQTGFLDAEPRTNPQAVKYPAIASVIAKHRGPVHPDIPPYVAFMRSRSHLAFGGDLGQQYDPFLANRAARLPIYDDVGVDTGRTNEPELFSFSSGLSRERLQKRGFLLSALDRLRSQVDRSGALDGMTRFESQAVEILLGQRARRAFDLDEEPLAIRARYGSHLWAQQALLARRLVEAGVRFVTIDLSYHPASGTWDTHGDNIPPYGGIRNGLGPLLPIFDHLITTLVADLSERGLLDEVLVVAMGEFGRTPLIGTQGSTDGRDHWPHVMSMLLAGGGLRHGQVIGSTEADGGHIKSRPVTPGDLAATLYRAMGVPLDGHYVDGTGRPRPIVSQGEPIAELF